MGSPSPSVPSPAHSRSPTEPSLQTSSSRHSCQHKEDARNLVVCIDGTSNQFGQNNTNVVKLFADLNQDSETPHPKQYAYYSSGIGTSPKSLPIFRRMEKAVTDKVGMAIAWNTEEIVKDAYGWLAQRYEEGDRIFLFGFSRGAYQVRVLAAMIHEVGLIKTATEKQVGTAYDHYKDMQSGRAKARQFAREFKKTFSWKNLSVHFVGVWDTVSSVGLVKEDVFLSTSSSAAHACHFRHALALDERRVKFMPEYFHEMNTLPDDGKSKYVDRAPNPANEKRKSGMSDSGSTATSSSREQSTRTAPDIKEVWFAGSHSDVGGRNEPGNSHQAGNVSLLWMRREAAEHGLALLPTDMVWVPDDLDFGISDSMGRGWRVIEYLPIRHQVSFSGAGKNGRRLHRAQPRRIIPGQKIHASILYSNAYKPLATLGEGFDLPIIHPGFENTKLDDSVWETGLFDDTAAEQLLAHLGDGQGVAPVYLDRLLFMLRFKEGKEHVRNTPDSKGKLMDFMSTCPALVKLVAIVAYYEAFCDSDACTECALLHEEPSEGTFKEAKEALMVVLAAEKDPDGPRVVALLAPLTRHRTLRQKLLTPEVLDVLVGLLDKIVENVKQSSGNFAQAMSGLTHLLQSEDTRKIMIDKLGIRCRPNSQMTRLSRILEVNNSHLLTLTALRMVLTLVRFPEAKDVCSSVRPRLRELAKKDVGPVGSLAVEILLALYDPNDQNQREQLNIRNANARANLSSVLVRLNPDKRGASDSSTAGQIPLASPSVCLNHNNQGDVDPGKETLCRLFGLDARVLSPQQKMFILELKLAVQHGTTRERTASTMTVLKLFESKVIRSYLLREIKLLDIFIEQLKRKDSALLAAYALVIGLTYDDMKTSIENNEFLPNNIVGMLRADYFDDAVGQVEGFEIFRSFMQHKKLREKIEAHPIANILAKKLEGGKPKRIRTSLICLDIFRSFNPKGGWSDTLVKKSLEHLRKPTWGEQKAGVTILSALVQTEHGVEAIGPQIVKIVEMLLPPDHRPVPPVSPRAAEASPTSPKGVQMQQATTGSAGPQSPTSSPVSPKVDSTPPEISSSIGQAPLGTSTAIPSNEVQPLPATTINNLPGQAPSGASTAIPQSESQLQPVMPITESADPQSPTSSSVSLKVRMLLKKILPVQQILPRNSTPGSPHGGGEPWPRPLPWMMGPACALRVLVRNKELRAQLRKSQQYGDLKKLHLTGALVYRKDTSSLRINTPNRTDVIYMLDKLIKTVDEDPPDEGFKSIEDVVLPHIRHWNRLVTLLGDRTMAMLSILPAILGVSTIGVLTLLVAVPVYVPPRVYRISRRALATIWARLRPGNEHDGPATEAGQGERKDETHPVPHTGEGSQGVETTTAH